MSHGTIIPDLASGAKEGWTISGGILTAGGIFTPPGIIWGFTTREAGDFGDPSAGAHLAAKYGKKNLKLLKQVHGDRIVATSTEESFPEGDGWLGLPGGDSLIGIKTADCLPILFWSKDGLISGAVHAGWRGAVKGIHLRFLELSGADPRTLYAVLGPAIGRCCYEVGPDVADLAGHDERWLIPGKPGKFMFDLKAYVKEGLQTRGMLPENIHDCGLCTMCRQDLFYSFRADPSSGRAVAFLGLKS